MIPPDYVPASLRERGRSAVPALTLLRRQTLGFNRIFRLTIQSRRSNLLRKLTGTTINRLNSHQLRTNEWNWADGLKSVQRDEQAVATMHARNDPVRTSDQGDRDG